ncbi:hypothetical protein COB55_03215 [Candidatus Wolfebacteria bacterium]|nr:MAG: hypothetical protein COB55_03215 [Candidatus Wolfebacteria bacterium]
MALIVEDGSNVVNANTYASLVTIRAYATARNISLNADDTVLESEVFKAMDYLEAQRSRYQGSQTYKTTLVDQSLQWPRKNVLVDCIAFPDDEIPQELIDAEGELVVQIEAGVNLFPTTVGKYIVKEKIDVIETTYSEKISTSSQPNLPSVDRLLDVLFFPCGTGNYLTNIRV